MSSVGTGTIPWLTVGTGAPLVLLPGLARRPQRNSASYAPLARVTGRTVHVLNRPTGLPRGLSMTTLAAMHAEILAARFHDAVDVIGVSTGGAIALQLAVDHPRLIHRLVVAAAASWLGDEGRQRLRDYGSEVAAGRSGAGILASVLFPSTRRWMMRPVLWLASRGERRSSPDDMLATIDAETTFDVTSRLSGISAKTLVVAGGRDAAFPLPLIEATAAAIPSSTLIVYPRAGHLGTMLHHRFGRDVAQFLSAPA
jgi:pimeloyl-ACP methyl ester carboxylesterase